MPRDYGDPPVKLYYRIGEVAGLVGVEPHVLRYWESEFPTIRPQKSRSGQRVYSRKDVEKLLRVKDLLYAQRFTIAGARQRLRGFLSEPGVRLTESVSCIDNAPRRVPSLSKNQEVRVDEPSDGLRVGMTTLRATLLAVREQVVGLLDSINNVDNSAGH